MIATSIWNFLRLKNSKKNSFNWNYSLKYGMYIFGQKTWFLRPRQLVVAKVNISYYFGTRSKKKNISTTENVLGYQNNDWLSQDDSFENISMIVENTSSGETCQSWCGMSSTLEDWFKYCEVKTSQITYLCSQSLILSFSW